MKKRVFIVCIVCIIMFVTYVSNIHSYLQHTGKRNVNYNSTTNKIQALSHDSKSFATPEEVNRFFADEFIIKGDVNCSLLFDGKNQTAVDHITSSYKNSPQNRYLTFLTRNCQEYIHDAHYITKPVSREEADFPLAFSILMYTDSDMAERLFRAIYRPQNNYCIHVDLKSQQVYEKMKVLSRCFDNVVLIKNRLSVAWGTYSVLAAEFLCMEALWPYKHWKYFINLTGQELPLRTNSELVKILKVFNNSNNIGASTKRLNRERFTYIHDGLKNTGIRKPPPPYNITLAKGSVHVALVRGSVNYILHDQRALTFRDWLQDTSFPEETFFASLSYNPHLGMPGTYTGHGEYHQNEERHLFVTRLKIWADQNMPCAGKYKRSICIISVGDLPTLAASKKMFVNKFERDYYPVAYDCVEQEIWRRVLQETQQTAHFNETYYK